MNIIETTIPDVKIIEPKVFGDERGFFLETFRDDWFKDNIADVTFVQDNHSKSSRGILRGMHYQLKQTQGKLVRVIAGEVYDVAIDMRKSSPSFGQSFGTLLSATNKRQMWVPAGFAHGFLVLSESADFLYKTTDFYAPEYERSIKWDDKDLNIEWPLIDGNNPVLSKKDVKAKALIDSEYFQ